MGKLTTVSFCFFVGSPLVYEQGTPLNSQPESERRSTHVISGKYKNMPRVCFICVWALPFFLYSTASSGSNNTPAPLRITYGTSQLVEQTKNICWKSAGQQTCEGLTQLYRPLKGTYARTLILVHLIILTLLP